MIKQEEMVKSKASSVQPNQARQHRPSIGPWVGLASTKGADCHARPASLSSSWALPVSQDAQGIPSFFGAGLCRSLHKPRDGAFIWIINPDQVIPALVMVDPYARPLPSGPPEPPRCPVG